jgi:DNA-binding response OmpR family regulator
MTAKPGLVILDVTLPRLRGDEICAMVRSSASLGHTPIIIISGQGTVESKLRLFEVGADDYVTKPFSMSELLARVESVLPLVERTVERTELSDAD